MQLEEMRAADDYTSKDCGTTHVEYSLSLGIVYANGNGGSISITGIPDYDFCYEENGSDSYVRGCKVFYAKDVSFSNYSGYSDIGGGTEMYIDFEGARLNLSAGGSLVGSHVYNCHIRCDTVSVYQPEGYLRLLGDTKLAVKGTTDLSKIELVGGDLSPLSYVNCSRGDAFLNIPGKYIPPLESMYIAQGTAYLYDISNQLEDTRISVNNSDAGLNITGESVVVREISSPVRACVFRVDSLKMNNLEAPLNISASELVVDSSSRINILNDSKLTKFVFLSDGYTDVVNIPSTTEIWCREGSTLETWCKNNGRSYHLIDDAMLDEIQNGVRPSLFPSVQLFDAQSPADVSFKVSLGKKPAGADDIKSVYVGNDRLSEGEYSFNGTDTLIISSNYLAKLANGIYSVSVVFDNNVYAGGCSVDVKGSIVQGGGNNPPEALTTIKYEFYKDYPDYVVIPVKMNGATDIIEVRLGATLLNDSDWELQDGALVISPDCLSTFDPGRYRILPKFNDALSTVISNLQLVVYENVADRGAPYLLQTRIVFKGDTVELKFDLADSDATDIIALQVDDTLLLANGETIPFSSSVVKKLRTEFDKITEEAEEGPVVVEEVEVATPSNASPATLSNASPATASSIRHKSVDKVDGYAVKSIIQNGLVSVLFEASPVFYTSGDTLYWTAESVRSLGLSVGDHLIGAVFNDSENTMDLKKVILTIEGEEDTSEKPGIGEDKPGTGGDKPSTGEDKPGTGEDKPSTGEDKPSTGEDVPVKPGTGEDKPNNPSTGGSSSGGSSGSSSSSGSSGGSSESSNGTHGYKNPDGSQNSNYRPTIPNYGGTWSQGVDGTWSYTLPDGSVPLSKWIADGKGWYWFDSDGKLSYNWLLDTTGKWYMLDKNSNTLGRCLYGWYFEDMDKKWYYFDTMDGHMLLGWQFIDGKWYYFTEHNNSQTYFGDNVTGWYYNGAEGIKPCGSMWCGETTPDGYVVDSSGAWVR